MMLTGRDGQGRGGSQGGDRAVTPADQAVEHAHGGQAEADGRRPAPNVQGAAKGFPEPAGEIGGAGQFQHVQRSVPTGQQIQRRVAEVASPFGPVPRNHRIDHAFGGKVSHQRPGDTRQANQQGEQQQPRQPPGQPRRSFKTPVATVGQECPTYIARRLGIPAHHRARRMGILARRHARRLGILAHRHAPTLRQRLRIGPSQTADATIPPFSPGDQRNLEKNAD